MIVLLKASFVVVFLLAFYKLFLERESFFLANRIYLLTCLALAFLLPFIVMPKLVKQQGVLQSVLDASLSPEASTGKAISAKQPASIVPEQGAEATPTLGEKQPRQLVTQATRAADAKDTATTTALEATDVLQKSSTPGIGFWLLGIYLFGVLILSLNLIAQIISVIRKVRTNADQIEDEGSVIVNMTGEVEPCSFFNYIFINPANYDFETFEQIIAHEKIHVRNRHTIDLLLAEIVKIVLWFNPFIWMFRKVVEKNLEYQTDDLLTKDQRQEKENYQLNLVKIACHTSPLAITTNYNQSLIKQRILKMNAKRSNRFNYWKYAFSLPLLFVLLLLLNKPMSSFAQTSDSVTEQSDQSSNTTAQQPIDENPAPTEMKTEVVSTSEKRSKNYSAGLGAERPSAARIVNCEEFEQAVAAGDLTRVKEILKNLDPDCLKVKHKKQSNLKSVEQLLAQKKQAFQEEEGAAEQTHWACERLEEAVLSRDKELVRQLLLEEDGSCLKEVNGQPTKDLKLIQGLLAKNAKIAINYAGVINIKDIGFRMDIPEEGYHLCDDRHYLNLLQAIQEDDEDKIRKILATESLTCPLNEDGFTNDFIFIKELMKYDPRIDYKKGESIMIYGIGAKIDLDLAAKEHKRSAADDLQEIEELLMPIHGEEFSCAELTDAILKNDYDLTESILPLVNPNCFHRETHTHSDEESNTTTTMSWVNTPLIAAARLGNLKIAQLLLHGEADLNFRMDENETALIVAAQEGNLNFVKWLVENGANTNISDMEKMTALDYAMEQDHQKIIAYLKSK